jgi:hypothetical protein
VCLFDVSASLVASFQVVLGLSKLKRLRMDRAHGNVHLAMRAPARA